MAAQRLADLRKDKELEALRKYLAEYDLFPRRRDPEIAPIRIEELKELAKHWKLHRNRGFWRDHPEKEDLVYALTNHVKALEAKKYRREVEPAEEEQRAKRAQARRMSRTRSVSPFKGSYEGDLFSQRGTYDEGMVYLSRMTGIVGETKRRPSRGEYDEDGQLQTSASLPVLGSGANAEEQAQGEADEAAKQANAQTEATLKRKLASSMYKLSYDPGHETSLVNESGLGALVALANTSDPATARYVAAALANLATHPYARQAMLEQGGVPALLELSNSHQPDTREHCALALARLTVDEGVGYKLVKDGVLSAIKTLLGQASLPVRDASTRALVNLLPAASANLLDGLIHSLVVLSGEPDMESLGLVADAMVNVSIVGAGRSSGVDEHLWRVITAMTESHSIDIKRKAAVTIVNLSATRANHEALAEQNVLATLRRLLATTSDELVLLLSVITANLSANRGGLQAKLARDGMVAVLQEISLRGDVPAKQNVALSFANMAWDVSCRPTLIKAGAVAVLVPFVTSGDIQCTRDALIGLCNLMQLEETQRLVLEARVIPAVVALAKQASAEPTLLGVCSLSLFNLSCQPPMRATMVEEGAAAVLVRMIEQHPPTADMERCLAALYNISQRASALETMLQALVVEAVILILGRTDATHETQRQCAAVLYNLSSYEYGREDMVTAGVLGPLIKQLSESPRLPTRLFVAGALGNLSKVEAALQGQGLMPCLIELSNTPDPDTLFHIATAFCSMATRRLARRMLAQDATTTPAVIALMRSGHGETQARCATTLCLLSREPGCIWPRGTVPDFIVIALLRVTSDESKIVCARVLFNLLTHAEQRAPMLKAGTLYALVKLARLDIDVIRQLTVAAIYNLSCDPIFAPELLSMGMIRVLCTIARLPGAADLRRDIAAALTNLTMFRHETQFIAEGALDALGPLVKIRNTTTRTSVAAMLANLSINRETWEHLARPRVIRILLVMAKSDARDMRRLSCMTFRNISRDQELHRSLINEDTIPALIEVLQKSPGADVSKTVVETLLNLLLFDVDYQTILVQSGGVPVLVELLGKASDVQTVNVCGKLITLVASNLPALHARMIREGVVQALVVMARSSPTEIMKSEISVALARLSRCSEVHRRIVEDGAVETIVRMCTPGEGLLSEVFRQRMAASLRNLSLHEPSRNIIAMERGAVAVLVELSQASRDGTRRDVAIAIYNLCSTMRARKELAKKGAVRALVTLNERGDAETKAICAVALHSLSGDGAEDEAGVVGALLSMMSTDPGVLQAPERSGTELADPVDVPPETWKLLPGHEQLWNPPHPEVDWRLQILEHVDTQLQPIALAELEADQLPPRAANGGEADAVMGEFERLDVTMAKRIAGRDLVVEEVSQLSSVKGAINDLARRSSAADDDDFDFEDDFEGEASASASASVELPPLRGASPRQ